MLFKNRKKKTNTPNPVKPRLNEASSFAVKEAYNAIRTKLMFSGKGETCPIFAVTSALAGDGKSTNAVSIAVSFALAGQRVLLIDADMRKPCIHRYFNMESRGGLSEILAGLTSEVKVRATDSKNLSVLTAGQLPPNPAELLATTQMDALLEYVRKYFDYVIIDTPPINIVSDAAVFAEKITGYIVITQSGKNQLRDVSDAVQYLKEMNGNISGFVLNDPNNRVDSHYSHRYSRYYRYGSYRYGENEK